MLEPQIACDRLRAAGLRLTPQRRAVIEVISGDTSHPTAESLYAALAERVPGMSLSTVYKVLNELSELRLVREIEAPGAKRFDPVTEDHVHVACDGCGALFDAPLPVSARRSIAAVVSTSGVSVDRLDVVVRGTCTTCNSA